MNGRGIIYQILAQAVPMRRRDHDRVHCKGIEPDDLVIRLQAGQSCEEAFIPGDASGLVTSDPSDGRKVEVR